MTTMRAEEEEVKILQFNQMRGVREGRKEARQGELVLSGQRA